MGNETITGPIIGQACATGARIVFGAAAEVEVSDERTVLTITADRCSNGPHIYYPNPLGPGGTGDKEDWVMDNFGYDPFAKNAMIDTAENVAKEAGITREEQDEMTLLRYQQYSDALKDDAAFLRRFMVMPIEVKDARGRKVLSTVEGDEGVFPTSADGLAKLKPIFKEGTITFGTQTHPADGNCGLQLWPDHHHSREGSGVESRSKDRDTSIVVRRRSGQKGIHGSSNCPGCAADPLTRRHHHRGRECDKDA
jgi:acetyl-CoA acetyltransferase